jgi:alpha-D-ribose 1-methylphosphonate 5-triphosphate synthase subunit PhnG
MNNRFEPHASIPPRSQWLRAWSALPSDRLETIVKTIQSHSSIEDLTLPKSGLGLLQLRDSAMGDTYFLGEIPLCKAHVKVTNASGEWSEGAALLMDDRTGLVRAMAILDATLGGLLDHWQDALALVQEGHANRQSEESIRKASLFATRVDFSLLSSTEEDEHEQ